MGVCRKGEKRSPALRRWGEADLGKKEKARGKIPDSFPRVGGGGVCDSRKHGGETALHWSVFSERYLLGQRQKKKSKLGGYQLGGAGCGSLLFA